MKKRQGVLFAVMCMFFLLFTGRQKVQANDEFWMNEIQKKWDSYTTVEVQVEKGEKFSIAEWSTFMNGDSDVEYGKTSKIFSKIKYSSSNKKVASVSKKGVVTAKKTGKTVIRLKKGKQKLTCYLKVVKKNSLKKRVSNAKQMRKKMNAVFKLYGTKVTEKNYIDLVYAVVDAEAVLKKRTNIQNGLYKTKKGTTNKMVFPEYPKYEKIKSNVEQYLIDNFASVDNPEFPLITELEFSGKSGTAVIAEELSAYHALALKLRDCPNYHLDYNGKPYKGIKRNKLVREYRLSRMNETTYEVEEYILKAFFTEGSNKAKVTSDVVIPPGVYNLSEYGNAFLTGITVK